MDALDSPVEALALNYLSYSLFTAVNRMWAAWAAAFTAAFSFWRIGASSPPRTEQRGQSKDAASTSCTPVLKRAVEEADETAEVSTPGGIKCISAPAATSCRVLERENITKGKFVLYYIQDGFRESGNEAIDSEDDDGVAAVPAREKSQQWCRMNWENDMTIRMGDMGWYRHQDLTVFNGSVVRLWDRCSRVCATA